MKESVGRLGKLPHRFDRRTLRLTNYLSLQLPPPPPSADYTAGVTSWGVLKNDLVGDCTVAAVAHAEQVWALAAGKTYVPTDETVLSYYSKWAGYDPTDPATDQGADALTILTDFQKQGFDGHNLLAFVDPQPQNRTHIMQSISLFGGVYLGVVLPNSAQDQVGKLWDVVADDGGTWGGHAIWVPAYSPDGLTCITWGALQTMTWAFFDRFCDEAHALLSADWPVPPGLDLAGLQADLQAIKN